MAALWSGRWVIGGCAALGLMLASFYVWRATPIFQADALVQVEAQQGTKSGTALEAKVEGISEISAKALGEAEILQSNQVLGRTVQLLHLDLVTEPKTSTLMGTALVRRMKPVPRLEVETFDLTQENVGVAFTLVAKENSAFVWKDPDNEVLAQGKVGEEVQATYQGNPMKLKVRSLVAKPGQVFWLQREHLLEAIGDLRENFAVSEKGKETDILALSFQHPDPKRGAEILNTILEQYSRQNLERRSQEASLTLSMVQEEMNRLHDKQMRAEQGLSQVQSGARSTDLGEEAKLVLQRSIDNEKEILGLQQKKAELLRTYTEQADVVQTVDRQIAKLQDEGRRLEAQVKNLPRTQQEVMRRSQEVRVNQEHYSALMNLEALNAQQLQMARAGEIGNAHVVDRALPGLKPVKPQKNVVREIGLLLGIMIGAGIQLLRRAFNRGRVEDPLVLEAQFGLPVLATIPHSDNQVALTRQNQKAGELVDILSTLFPADLAVESLRSLRTSLHFTLVDAPSRAIMIAGASPEIGKSFVNTNFATVLAQYGAKVLLVDADMRKGKLHRHFGVKMRMNGLSEVLVGSLDWRDALHHANGLDMISTGTLPPNPSKLLLGDRFGTFIEEACAAYDYVIVDAPPILAVTDAAIIGAHMGAVLLLVKDGQHPLGEIRAALQSLDIAGTRVKGFVFNDINPQGAGLGFHRHTYYYGYQS